MNYVASPYHAYDATRYISTRAPLGLVNSAGLHFWGASAMVVMIGAQLPHHVSLGQTIRIRGETTGVTGVVLFLIVMLFGSPVPVLPWNRNATGPTVVGTNIAGRNARDRTVHRALLPRRQRSWPADVNATSTRCTC